MVEGPPQGSAITSAGAQGPAGRQAGVPGRHRSVAMSLYVALQCLAAMALLLSFLFSPEAVPRLWGCPFERILHLPCPGCGMTRAFCAISHGDLVGAWVLNPFAYVFYGGAVVAIVWPFVLWRRPGWERALRRSRAVTVGALLLVGAMWVFGLLRILCLTMADCSELQHEHGDTENHGDLPPAAGRPALHQRGLVPRS